MSLEVEIKLNTRNETKNTTKRYQQCSVLQNERRKVRLSYNCDRHLHVIVRFSSLHLERVNNSMFILFNNIWHSPVESFP